MNEKSQITELRTAIGGKTITTKTRSGDIGSVFVKELSVKASDIALTLLDNEFGLAQLFTDLLPENLEALTPDSFNEVIETGNEVNASFFVYCVKRAQRRTKLQDQIMPGMRERLLARAEQNLTSQMDSLPGKGSGSSAPVSRP
jgi:hypothetical protein